MRAMCRTSHFGNAISPVAKTSVSSFEKRNFSRMIVLPSCSSSVFVHKVHGLPVRYVAAPRFQELAHHSSLFTQIVAPSAGPSYLPSNCHQRPQIHPKEGKQSQHK